MSRSNYGYLSDYPDLHNAATVDELLSKSIHYGCYEGVMAALDGEKKETDNLAMTVQNLVKSFNLNATLFGKIDPPPNLVVAQLLSEHGVSPISKADPNLENIFGLSPLRQVLIAPPLRQHIPLTDEGLVS